jgi:hypothetical protein
MFTNKQVFSKVIITLIYCVVLNLYLAPCKVPHYKENESLLAGYTFVQCQNSGT